MVEVRDHVEGPGWQDVRRVFETVAELSADERHSALNAACGDDGALRAAVEELLRSDRDAADRFLDPVSPEHLSETFDSEWARSLVGTRIGAYALRRVLGHGGMGMVFEAEQDDPRRSVALKVLRPGAVSEVAFARFREESTVLGRLQHPAVAQVIEAGRAETSRGTVPWFAMVLIPGARDLLSAARESGLDEAQRLRLFLEICDGVQHGHLRGVIHCDLKPANLLVDEEGRPHIIDFGVARLALPRANEDAPRLHGPAGTWRYMAPEELDGGLPDVRADVYALGVSLYELLCGQAPLDFGGATTSTACASVVRFTPPVPPRRYRPDLSRDLEWILLRALAKEPERRYASVAELADDLGRYLRDLPVEAAPGGATYRARKFLRRRRGPVIASVVFCLTLLAGAVGVLVKSRQAAEEGKKASELYDYISSMLREPFLEVSDGDDVRFVDVVARAAEQVDERFGYMPGVRGELHRLYGTIYGSLGKNDRAVEHMLTGLDLLRAELGDDAPEVNRVLPDLGVILVRSGRYGEAEALMLEALSRADRIPELTHLVLLINLATIYADCRKDGKAEPVARKALDLAEATLHPDHPLRMSAESSWAGVLEYGFGDHEGAARLLERIVKFESRRVRDRHPDLMRAKMTLARVYERSGRTQVCADLLAEVLVEQRRVFSPAHPLTMRTLFNLAQVKERSGLMDEAETLRLERLGAMRKSLAAGHPVLVEAVMQHGEWLIGRERPEDALAFWRDDLTRRAPGPDPAAASIFDLRWRTARLLLELGRKDEARQCLEAVAALLAERPDEVRQELVATWLSELDGNP